MLAVATGNGHASLQLRLNRDASITLLRNAGMSVPKSCCTGVGGPVENRQERTSSERSRAVAAPLAASQRQGIHDNNLYAKDW